MKIGKNDIKDEAGYEKQYLTIRKHSDIYYFAYTISLLCELISISLSIEDSLSVLAFTLLVFIRYIIILPFFCFMWHKNFIEQHKNVNRAQTGWKIKCVLKSWLAIVQTVLSVSLLVSAINAIYTLVLNILYEWGLLQVLTLVGSISGIITYFGVFYYLIQYFRWYRWTWEELQLPPKERKAHYKAKKLAERQKKREAREVKRAAARDRREAGGGVFFRSNERPAAKTVKSQTDRRAELESLKKLYDEGLIDEEEYKKAREKTLGI